MTTLLRPHCRWCIRRDVPEVLAIEAATQTHPWDEDEFLRVLRRRSCIGHVAEVPVRGEWCDVVGHTVYELLPHALRILRLGVLPRFQRCGVGTALVQRLKDKCGYGRRSRLVYSVSEYDLDRQLWLKAVGFRCTGCLPDGSLRFVWRLEP